MWDGSAQDVYVNTCDPGFVFLYVLIEDQERDIYVLSTLDECIAVSGEGRAGRQMDNEFEILTVG